MDTPKGGPPSAFFFPAGAKIKEIPIDFYNAPWAEDIDHRVLARQL